MNDIVSTSSALPGKDTELLQRFGFSTHRSVECPYCASTIGFPMSVANQTVRCPAPSCGKEFHYDDGLIATLARLASIDTSALLIQPIRMGYFEIGKSKITPGQWQRVKFQKKMYRVQAVRLNSPKGSTDRVYEDDSIIAAPVLIDNEGFTLLACELRPNQNSNAIEIDWFASGIETDQTVSLWIVFLQNAFNGGVIGTIASLAPFSGTLLGGRLVNRVGRKPIAVVPPIISGVFAIAFTFVPGMVFSLALLLVQGFFGGLMLSGLFNLALEQVPSFRSSMMSIANSFQNLGTILGIVIGGAILSTLHPNAGNFQLLMTVLGVGGIASGLVLLLAKDPCKTQKSG